MTRQKIPPKFIMNGNVQSKHAVWQHKHFTKIENHKNVQRSLSRHRNKATPTITKNTKKIDRVKNPSRMRETVGY